MPYTKGLIGTYRRLYEDPPDESHDGGQFWFHRTQNMIAVYMAGMPGAKFRRQENPDEYFVWPLFHRARVTAGDASVDVPAGSIVIVPPGDSSIELLEEGHVWLGFTSLSSDLIDRCPNKSEYDTPLAHVTPVVTWPEPVGGYRIRVYNLFDLPAGKPQCYVHRTAMTNFGYGFPAFSHAKPDTDLSPHFHDDFEQISLVHSGTHVYHMRRPWGRDGTKWMPDEHVVISTPGIAVAKPPDIHTIQVVSNGTPGGVLDFFSPVRWDYSTRKGMVTNSADYPVPSEPPTASRP
ncbi:hypothetical protein FHT86_007743 [Rhizobium sp. BK313]|uniref:hypothetical protein n=1 Tax=Rhizobium sp. BK313 TaxID=2587081 RepID=UPI0010618931|nr:hypothetical protein [Rhizobium sp. BK313]MBB3459411.1 hypothetical protein [Rhizobium sp. BK313]